MIAHHGTMRDAHLLNTFEKQRTPANSKGVLRKSSKEIAQRGIVRNLLVCKLRTILQEYYIQ
jgi:hypothetical protein